MDADCSAGEACHSGACMIVTPCTSSRMCPGLVCDTTLGYCVECVTDADCVAGNLCRASNCVPPPTACTTDRECSAMGLVCDTAMGHCAECVRASDCPTDRYCSAGVCVPDVCSTGQAQCATSTSIAICLEDGSGYGPAMPCGGTSICAANACQSVDSSTLDAGADAAAEDGGSDAGTVADAGRADVGVDAGSDADVDGGIATCVVDETVESTAVGAQPAGWTQGCFAGSPYTWAASATAHGGARSLSMDFRGSGGEAAVGIPVAWPTSGVVDVSFWFRPETTDQNIYILPVRGDQRLFNALPFTNAGVLQGTTTPYVAGTWYHVDYVIDFDHSTFEILVDGSPITAGPFATSSLPCTLSGGDYLSFHGGYVDQKWLGYLDDLTICGGSVSTPRFALSFDGGADGTADQVQFPTDIGAYDTAFTFEAWVMPTSDTPGSSEGEGGYIFAHRKGCQDFALEWSGNVERLPSRYRLWVYPTSGCGSQVSAEASFTSSIDAWHHVAGVFDAGSVRIYVDGVLGASVSQPNPISWAGALGNWAGHDGADARPQRSAFIGAIDEIRLSSAARYSGSSFVPPRHLEADADTVAAWLFDEGAGTTTADSSGHGYDGTISGASWVVSTR